MWLFCVNYSSEKRWLVRWALFILRITCKSHERALRRVKVMLWYLPSHLSCFQAIMSLVSLLSIILVAQLPSHTFGKSLTSIDAGSAVIPNSEIARLVENPRLRVESYDESRTRRNSKLNDGDDDDILINKLSREYVTSNLFDSATACNK